MVLSHDACCLMNWFPNSRVWAPNWNYRHIPDDILPALRQAGVGDEQIKTMTVVNPAQVFGG